jgi:pilus assembly protein Flp/PilA
VLIRRIPMKNVLALLLHDTSGATAIEYAMIAAGVATAIIAAVNTLGNNVLTTKFQVISNSLSSP